MSLWKRKAKAGADTSENSSARLPSPDPARSSSSSRPSTIPSGSLSPDPFPDSAMTQEPSNHAAVPPPAATAPAVSGTSSDDEDYVDISTSDYAKKRKGLMELNRDLRALGAQTIIPLPCIAVIGGQSAGKSSLVEAVSGINVPRDSGTCTRCPTECSLLSTSASWSCQITLRFDYDDDGKELQSSRSVTFGPLLTTKDDVEIWLRRAQAAVLSPHLEPRYFYSRSKEELQDMGKTDPKVLKFSRNAVCVQISDPDATDLSFIDLPGLIQNETAEAIDLVRNLVVDSIADDHTLILVAIPMSDDMENQQAVKLAREADPSGERTIGVLTKPDTLSAGATNAREKWREVLEDRIHRLKHRYYCVRLPDDDERSRKITRTEVDRNAEAFFSTTSPWKDIMVNDPRRFGMPNFVNDISVLLTAVIEKALPSLKNDVDRLLYENAMERASLPEVRSLDPMTEVLGRVNTFCDQLRGVVSATGRDKSLVHRNKASYAAYKLQIRITAPDFRPFDDPDMYENPEVADGKVKSSDWMSSGRVWGVYDVRKTIKSETGWELPHYIPFDATKLIVNESLKQWRTPTIACFETVYETLRDVVEDLVQLNFGHFKLLAALISSSMLHELESKQQDARSALVAALALESGPFMTMNDHYYESTRQKWLNYYCDIRRHASRYLLSAPLVSPTTTSDPCLPDGLSRARSVPTSDSAETRALKALSELGYKHLSLSDLGRLHPPDRFIEEITVMADVRAYWQAAYKRIIDYIPLTIEHTLNQAISCDLQRRLWVALDLGGADVGERLKTLLSEDPAVAAKRRDLEAKRQRLLAFQAKLARFKL